MDALVKPYPICPTCHGVHKGIPECVGRPQTDTEHLVDRGVRPEVAANYARARGNRYPPLAELISVDAPTPTEGPYGRPETPPPAYVPTVQEALF